MPFLICPECGEHNPLEAEFCSICQASLADVVPSEEEPIAPETEQGDDGLFTEGESDLPDLLESLKQESLPLEAETLPGIELNADAAKGSQEDESSEAGKTPDWLEVVRKRAQQEEDAVGDLSKRLSDAQENLKQEKRESQHEDFESWIQKLREEARDKAAGGPVIEEENSPPEEEVEEDEPKWLSRIRKVSGVPEEKNEPDAAGRSLLEWLVELEEQRTAGEPAPEMEATQRVVLPPSESEPDATREIRISAAQQGRRLSTLDLTREDREQADQLTATIADETADRPIESRPYRKPIRLMNSFFALLLIAGLAFMLLTGRVVSFKAPVLPSAGQAVLDWAAGLPEDANVLLVFDYQPAYTAEMERVAKPVLTQLFTVINTVEVISSSPSGPLLSSEILTDYQDLTVVDRGYVPDEAFGAFGFASGAAAGSTSLNKMIDVGAYTDILILSDRFESAQGWVAQWSAIAPEATLNLLVTAQAGPLLQPYVESGQINGMVAGLTEAVALEASLGQKGAAAAVWQAYQVGILVMLGGLVIGAVAGPVGYRPGRKRGRQ